MQAIRSRLFVVTPPAVTSWLASSRIRRPDRRRQMKLVSGRDFPEGFALQRLFQGKAAARPKVRSDSVRAVVTVGNQSGQRAMSVETAQTRPAGAEIAMSCDTRNIAVIRPRLRQPSGPSPRR